MTHLEIITEAYDHCEIIYVVIDSASPGYQYLFMVGTETRKAEFERTDLDTLLRCYTYIEFENGEVASY